MEWFGVNHNVVLCLLMWSLYSLSDSVWNGTVFVSYLYVMAGDSNTEVGIIEAAQGMLDIQLRTQECTRRKPLAFRQLIKC
jgi:hypothetical protein